MVAKGKLETQKYLCPLGSLNYYKNKKIGVLHKEMREDKESIYQ